jgi:hypothetical protein
MSKRRMMIAGLLLLGACTREPRTDQELTARAQQAVDRKLGVQAQFSLMESAVAQHIACGHALPANATGGGQDFVYRDGRVILDNDPDFDAAAIQCDDAVSGVAPDNGDDGNAG